MMNEEQWQDFNLRAREMKLGELVIELVRMGYVKQKDIVHALNFHQGVHKENTNAVIWELIERDNLVVGKGGKLEVGERFKPKSVSKFRYTEWSKNGQLETNKRGDNKWDVVSLVVGLNEIPQDLLTKYQYLEPLLAHASILMDIAKKG